MARSRYYPGPKKDWDAVRDILMRRQLLAAAAVEPVDQDPIQVEVTEKDEVTLTRTDEHAIFQLVFGTETAHAGYLH